MSAERGAACRRLLVAGLGALGLVVLPGAAGRARAQAPASAPDRPHLALRVAVDVERRSATGTLAADIRNPSAAALDHLELWRYPARLDHPSPALDAHNFYWVYPRRFDAGGMEVSSATVDGVAVTVEVRDGGRAGPGTLLWLPLPAPLGPGATAHLEVAFTTRVPERYGPFGCYRHDCTLSGGFYPMPVELAPPGYDRTAPPARADIDVTVTSAAPTILVDGADAQAGTAVHLRDAAWAVLHVGRPFAVRTLEHRGVRVVYHHRGGRPPALLDGDRARMALDELREAIDMLDEIGLPAPVGTEVRLVETPLRLELCSPQAGAVLVSDQIYRLFPARRFRKFHSFQLVQAVFDVLLEARLSARESPADLAFSPDVAAAWLTDLFTVRVYRKKEFARDILRWVGFIPAIDRILYAPQIPFASAYFNTLDDPDPMRDDLHRFGSDWPRGKLIHEKLRDLLGDRGMTEVLQALWQGAPLRRAAEAVRGAPLDAFFATWLGPMPEVDYRFTITRRERTATGYRYHFRVEKRGPTPPEEPVELQIVEWSGTRHMVRWDGRGRANEFAIETRHRLRAVFLDPRGRLTESIAGDNNDRRLDDRSPAPVKLIYNNFGALFNFQTLSLDLSLDFSLQRIYDLKNTVRLLLYHSESTVIGGLIGYSRGFGRKILPSRLSSALTTSLRVARLDSGFASAFSGSRIPGTRLSLAGGLGYDDRAYIWEPWDNTYGSAALSYAVTILDDARAYQQITVSGLLGHGFHLRSGHDLAVEAQVAATFGDLRIPSQALFAGGPSGVVRGYEADEIPGASLLGARAEYRHVFVHDLDFNLVYFAYLRGISGGLFAEAAVVSACSAADERQQAGKGSRALFADVGYSLRLLGDLFGVSQTIFNIDVAVPWETLAGVPRQARSCFAAPGPGGAPPPPPPSRFPIGFFVYFGPVW